jgi:hypothetical protein
MPPPRTPTRRRTFVPRSHQTRGRTILASLILITSRPYPGRRSPFFALSLWHAAEVALSPWSRRRRSGPLSWPGRQYAHAFALALCNHTRTHVPVPSRATMRALAWRGQGQAYGSLLRLTLSALRPATGRGFAAEGNPSSPEARAPTRSRSCAPTLAHARANPVVTFHTSSEIKSSRSRQPRRSTSPHCRGRPSAWAHERQAKSVHVFVHTHAGEHPGVPPRSSPPWPSHRHACVLK